MALLVKNPPANAGDVRDAGSVLSLEDALEEEMATSSSILAWRIPWTEEAGGLQSMGCKESDMTEQLNYHYHICVYVYICVCRYVYIYV